MSGVDWSALLDAIDAEDPPALEVAERLADARDLDPVEAQNRVYDAIDSGDLVEDGDGFGGVRLAGEAADDTGGSYRPEDTERPLDQYEARGYAFPVDDEDSGDDTVRARDAAAALTASRWGPPFATAAEDGGVWWEPAYKAATGAVERAIIDALLASGDDPDVSGETDEESPEEAGSPAPNPPPEGEEMPLQSDESDLQERAHQAFAAAVEFFHNQLDRDISGEFDGAPDTPRDYYEGVRGWSPETIADKRLGYAPADGMALLDHLMSEGFDGDAIQGTGLFYEDFTPHFQGRYVLPYFDEDGRPVYAISRSLNHHEDGHGDDPKGDQKYTKAIKTKDRSHVDEPIYGAETVTDDTDRLLVVGGIADAITLHEAGYACISPVTTVRFKSKHEPRVAGLVDEYGLDGVYMLNDAERPSVDSTELEDGETVDRIGDVLTIMQHGEGLRGAFGNAEFLLDEGIDAYLVKLPAGGDYVRKIDPDDVIKDGWASVDTLLAAARHADHHDGYQGWAADRRSREVRDAMEMGDRASDHAGETTELFDLGFTDVAPLSVGDRQNNPFGHHGDSEGYFVCAEKQGFVHGYDHKYSVAYNALSYLLCDAGERRADDPNGPLDDEELFVAWRHAKSHGHLATADPIPFAALREVAVRDGVVERDDLVERGDSSTYLGFPDAEAYNAALEHIDEEYGLDPGREPVDRGRDTDDSADTFDDDPREVLATVDARRAWDAAGRVAPADLDTDALDTTEDGEAFACPACGDSVDAVRAVALAEGLVDTCDATLDDEYPEAYGRAREAYGAPLPEYYTTSDAIARFDALLDLIGEVTFWHLDTDALNTEITQRDDEVDGEAVRALNPAWRESESEASVLVFDSGNIWDADTERTLDVLRFVALDSGLIDEPGEALEGELFTTAYDRARRVYGAPLPRWEPAEDGAREVTPQLPPSEELLDGCDLDGVDTDALGDAREEVEALIENAAADAEAPTVVTSLPATGKTTGTVKTAQDRPLSYLAPRKELQQQALAKAERWGVEAEVLPVFSDERVRDGVLNAAVSHVREAGKDRLRDRWAILAAAFDGLNEDDEEGDTPDLGDIFDEDDEDDVELDRPTCDTAEGDHGVAWALAVHVARRLGYTPREIHQQAAGLFGAPLPCTCDDHGEKTDSATCEYSAGWDSVSDPHDRADLLVGSYIHAHVDSVRTEFTKGADGDVETAPRALVLDEYVGEAYVREFGEEAHDFATWLARCLRDDVADRRDMFDADLYGDDWVRAWLDGEGAEVDGIGDAVGSLGRTRDLLDAREAAGEILEEVDSGLLSTFDLVGPLERVAGGDGDVRAVLRDLADAIAAVDPEHPAAGIAGWADDAVREPLDTATASGSVEPGVDGIDTDTLPISSDLRGLVEAAVEAVADGRDDARPRIDAAVRALRGGREGCRRLAAWADDGYAHPDAHHLLTNIITPTGEDGEAGAARVRTSSWAFDPDATDGTVVDVVRTGEKARTVVDRNDHGAHLQTPPARLSAGGEDVPLVGLDATGRSKLWTNALDEPVDTADIHDTPEERAEFLENALSLRVLQASDRPRSYEGDPGSKDTDGDVALLEAIAEEYAGLEAPRQRGDEAVPVGNPAAITTKGVRQLLEADSRLDDVVADWENYGNLTGANDLGDHRLAAILGSQHYGDDAIERFCALDGREVDTDRGAGRGGSLEYGDPLADAYHKHMAEDQTMQAILRFARGDSGATVVARTSALREDLPVVGRAQVVDTWSDTATTIAREYRRLGDEFTAADVADSVDVSRRQVRRVLAELVEAGYLRRVGGGDGLANVYEPSSEPGAGEVDLPERGDAVAAGGEGGHTATNQYYTWNVRVHGVEDDTDRGQTPDEVRQRGAPPSPTAVDGAGPPG